MQWEKFLSSHGIEYVTSGPNTKRGEVSVACPFCGADDPSQHLGISLSRDVWGCHRNSAHRGKSPVRLVAALLGCSMSTAQLTLKQYTQNDPDDLEQALAMLTEEEKPVEEESLKVEWPKEFQPIKWGSRFASYLESRGFNEPIALSARYNLRCASTGRYKDRIIFPLYLNGDLIGWTARAITNPVKAPRYLASSPRAKMTVYGQETVKPGKVLFIVEGPFDALRINAGAQVSGVNAVALMGTSMTVPQFALIRKLQKQHKLSFVWLDSDAYPQAASLADMLSITAVSGWFSADPADLGTGQLHTVITAALKQAS